jgi:hypothetical protein
LEAKQRLYEMVKGLLPKEQIKKLISTGKPFAGEMKRLKSEQKNYN